MVDQAFMIDKLTSYGGPANCFISYLDNRQECCSINGRELNVRDVTCSILQGSCLCPFLFILYLNDFKGSRKYSRANIYAVNTIEIVELE